jgi:hypothetical protein
MVEPKDEPDEVSFGWWRVTNARPKSLLPTSTVVEIRLTPVDLVVLGHDGQVLVRWSIDKFGLADNGAHGLYLRLGSEAAFSIESPEQRGAHELGDALVGRRTPGIQADAQSASLGCLSIVVGLVVWLGLWFVDFWVLAVLGLQDWSFEPIWWVGIVALTIGGPALGVVAARATRNSGKSP